MKHLAAESVNTACAVPIEDQQDDRDQQDVIGESTTDRTEDEVARRQEGREQTVPVAETTRAGVDEQVELPVAVAVAVELVELPDYEMGGGENDERISLVKQPVELAWRRLIGEAWMVKSKEEDISGRVVERAHHSFCFSPPKRDRKLSDEEQQDEAKRPKSPEREGEQLAEEMQTDMREIPLGVGEVRVVSRWRQILDDPSRWAVNRR